MALLRNRSERWLALLLSNDTERLTYFASPIEEKDEAPARNCLRRIAMKKIARRSIAIITPAVIEIRGVGIFFARIAEYAQATVAI